jgi:hypothetical protein
MNQGTSLKAVESQFIYGVESNILSSLCHLSNNGIYNRVAGGI